MGWYSDHSAEWKTKGRIIYIAVIIFILIVSCLIGGGSSEDNWETEDAGRYAYNATKDYVVNSLKSPSTAKFPGYSDAGLKVLRKINTQQYVITGYVDAQNSFGATVRTRFTATVEQTAYRKWKLLSLKWL